ncbi:hypothetical protein HAX54_000667, partial [Datura stramonium]|nr:hypothetical protein [Datura stramonium]
CSTSRFGDLGSTNRAIDGIFGFDRRSFSKLNPCMIYSPLVPSKSHYNVYLQSIMVNGQILPINPAAFATSADRGGTIIDSGTTLVHFALEAYEPFVNAITAAVSPSARPILFGRIQCYLVSPRKVLLSGAFRSGSNNFRRFITCECIYDLRQG